MKRRAKQYTGILAQPMPRHVLNDPQARADELLTRVVALFREYGMEPDIHNAWPLAVALAYWHVPGFGVAEAGPPLPPDVKQRLTTIRDHIVLDLIERVRAGNKALSLRRACVLVVRGYPDLGFTTGESLRQHISELNGSGRPRGRARRNLKELRQGLADQDEFLRQLWTDTQDQGPSRPATTSANRRRPSS